MGEKFDLDSIKSFIDSSDNTDNLNVFVLDDILKDYSKSHHEQQAEVIVTDTENEKDETIISDEQSLINESSTAIVEDIEKPEGFSLTGAFEAIKSEKSSEKEKTETKQTENEQNEQVTENSPENTQADVKQDKEIFDTIEHKRYFNTDTFNSIKNKSTASVKDSIASFANGMEEEDDGEEQFIKPHEPTEEIYDYTSEEDREAIIAELKKITASSSVRVLFTFILCAISALFFAVSNSWISLPGINIETDFKTFTVISFGLSVLSAVVNFNSIAIGLKSIAKLKFNVESFIVSILLLNVVLNICYLTKQSTDGTVFISFDFILSLFLLLNIFSKKLIAKTIYKNFLITSADGCKNVINTPNNEEALNDIMLETGCQSDIVYASKTEFVSDFIDKSFEDFEPKNSKIEAVLFFVSFAMAIVYFVFKHSFEASLIYLISALSLICPMLFAFSFATPLFLNSKKTRKHGGVILGSKSASTLNDVQTLIVDDSDIFNASLNGIRLYGDSSIDDAILYLNALYSKVGGPLTNLFSDMLSDNIVSLPRIDDIYYHDTMGYSGLIHSKVFVAGNKKLMDHFGVEVDDSEYEIIYQQKSKHVLFVAYDGKLMGVFLLSYSLSHGVKKAFEICEKNQIAVCIAERDPNVNSKTLFGAYTPKEKILFNIISFRTARKCFEKFETQHKSSSLIISRTGIKGLAVALGCCKTLMFAFKTNKVIRILASVLALPLVSFLLFFSDASAYLSAQILIYQLLWSLPILFVSLFSK